MAPLIRDILSILTAHPEVLSFIAPIVASDAGVIFVAFLAASGAFSPLIVLFWAWVSTLLLDSLWFFFPRTRFFQNTMRHRFIDPYYRKLEHRLQDFTKKADIWALFASKALIGTRILVILFVSARNMSYWQFLIASAIANMLWVAALVFVGILARSGFERTLELFEDIQIALLFLVIFFVFLYYLLTRIRAWILSDSV